MFSFYGTCNFQAWPDQPVARVSYIVGATCSLIGLCPPICPPHFGWIFYVGISRIQYRHKPLSPRVSVAPKNSSLLLLSMQRRAASSCKLNIFLCITHGNSGTLPTLVVRQEKCKVQHISKCSCLLLVEKHV